MRKYLPVYLLLLCTCFLALTANAQTCPANIGFEEGNFNGWQAYSGRINLDGTLSLAQTGPLSGVHTLLKYSFPLAFDYYGGFPLVSPNGSDYIVQLGNSAALNGAERLSYTFTVPANTTDYNFIYNYAVVLFSPRNNRSVHLDYEQPRFTAKVFDVGANQYIDCGSFDYTPETVPNFQTSQYNPDVFYKSWTPVSIDLSAYAGKQIRLEFTTNDCSKERGSHFGYAYIDVEEACTAPIKGNAYCIGDQQVVLRAPEGFKTYAWYKKGQTGVLGTQSRLTLNPAPPDGTEFEVKVEPYDKVNCQNTLTTTIRAINEQVVLNVQPNMITACENTGADIRAAYLTQGSSAGLTYSYYADADATMPLPRDNVRVSGTYYIKGENAAGCYQIKPITVNLLPAPQLRVKEQVELCAPATYNLMDAVVQNQSSQNLTYSFWMDKLATVPSAQTIGTSGTYYIKGQGADCSNIMPVVVNITPVPVLHLTAPPVCPPVNLAAANVYAGSTPGLSYTYWTDAAATIPVSNPENLAASGTYYVKGTTAGGCYTIAPLQVKVEQAAQITVLQPDAVVFPETIDLERTYTKLTGYTYSYWQDAATTKALTDPSAIKASGTFYIKAVNAGGCMVVIPVKATIKPPPDPEIVFANTFSPNNDGVNDLFKPSITGTATLRFFKIFNRYGRAVFSTTSLSDAWNGNNNGEPVPAGTYFWIFEGTNTYNNQRLVKSGSVTVVR